ncbi:MAG: DUF1659 domain-containing protein [Negativicutes bacterium]
MAVVTKEESTKLLLKVENGQTAGGKTAYAERSIADVNPQLTNDDLYAVGNGIAGLQTKALKAIRRQNTVTLAEE